METLASILSGAGANPYQSSGTGGGISPLLTQLVLAKQMGASQVGQPMPVGQQQPIAGGSTPPVMPPMGQQVPGQPSLPQGFGSLAALPALISGAY